MEKHGLCTVQGAGSVTLRQGFLRLALRLSAVLLCAVLAFSSGSLWGFIAWSVAAGVAGAWTSFLFHDAMHLTLTGKRVIDRGLLRWVVAPFFLPYTLASYLHIEHHRQSGRDFKKDPEVNHWTKEQYLQSSPLSRWYYRNKLWIQVFVAGTFFGVLTRFWWQAFQRRRNPKVMRIVFGDVLCIFVANLVIFTFFSYLDLTLYYLLFLFIAVDRTAGVLLQLPFQTTHYGVWSERPGFSQVLSTCNVVSGPTWFWTGIGYHSAHHLFPRLPSQLLPAVHISLKKALLTKGVPLYEEKGFLKTLLKRSKEPCVMDGETFIFVKDLGKKGI